VTSEWCSTVVSVRRSAAGDTMGAAAVFFETCESEMCNRGVAVVISGDAAAFFLR
jgi:hypothetical protein